MGMAVLYWQIKKSIPQKYYFITECKGQDLWRIALIRYSLAGVNQTAIQRLPTVWFGAFLILAANKFGNFYLEADLSK